MTTPGENFEKQEGVRWLLQHFDETVPKEEGVRYQTLLRALGSWLDSQTFSGYTALETGREFTIVTRDGEDGATLSTMTFAKLVTLERDLRAHRGPSGPYQDFLRALGHELDEAVASNILLEEVEDGLLLTYLMLPPDSSLMWKKQHVLLDTDDRSNLLKKAVGRRAQVEYGRWGLKKIRTR
jgi:hypothetical protein